MNLTRTARRYLRLHVTLDDALPTRTPVYVNSVVYLFGATALMALAWIVLSGVVLTLGGPSWCHTNSVGRFANSVDFWSAHLLFFFFFFGLVLHFVTKRATHARSHELVAPRDPFRPIARRQLLPALWRAG
jgi:hypothetical protein